MILKSDLHGSMLSAGSPHLPVGSAGWRVLLSLPACWAEGLCSRSFVFGIYLGWKLSLWSLYCIAKFSSLLLTGSCKSSLSVFVIITFALQCKFLILSVLSSHWVLEFVFCSDRAYIRLFHFAWFSVKSFCLLLLFSSHQHKTLVKITI